MSVRYEYVWELICYHSVKVVSKSRYLKVGVTDFDSKVLKDRVNNNFKYFGIPMVETLPWKDHLITWTKKKKILSRLVHKVLASM